jgi:hypothetical protein
MRPGRDNVLNMMICDNAHDNVFLTPISHPNIFQPNFFLSKFKTIYCIRSKNML